MSTPTPTARQNEKNSGAHAGVAGKTTIEDGVVAKVVGIATRDVPGVYALGGGAARALGAIRDAVGNTDLTQGISVEVGEKQAAVDITIVVDYPQPLQEVSDSVRSAVYRAVEKLVGLDVVEVNVTVTDIHIPSEDNEKDGKDSKSKDKKATEGGRVE
ncbi:Asp23/Gls24 family envelope stress response protein [Acaricomes phytoseiuli]|uniref:Asp23/Gls24 family envelope stress response protein n=1 Tax=Acaricomes phytoseiuli TaxID=291968 RepID=UPI0003612FED|nr:Asp23/Gls24 family envelope stress response protein [Acaricomes phytoseiuli]